MIKGKLTSIIIMATILGFLFSKPVVAKTDENASLVDDVLPMGSNDYSTLTPIETGTCGQDVPWSIYENDKGMHDLVIGGGTQTKMNDYLPYEQPWRMYSGSIENVVIGEEMVNIGGGAFSGFSSLKSINIPDNVMTIGEKAFYESGIQSITISSNVNTIGFSAFENCKKLKTVNLPDNLLVIGDRWFYGCEDLTDIEIPYGIQIIYDYAFYNCTSITSISLPDTVTTVYYSAFACDKASNMESMYIPNSVVTVYKEAFGGKNKAAIYYGGSLDDMTKIDHATYSGSWPIADREIYYAGPNIVPLSNDTTIKVGESLQLSVVDVFLDSDHYVHSKPAPDVIWSTNGDVKFSIDENGLLTAIKEGTGKAIAKDSTGQGERSINVKEDKAPVTVSFVSNNDDVIPDQTVEYNGRIIKPSKIKAKTGYTFVNWYTSDSVEWDFNTPVTEDITLYAKWNPRTYTVSFSSDGVIQGFKMDVTFDDKYGTLPSMEKDGYVFKGWRLEYIEGMIVTDSSIVSTASNHTLYAYWLQEGVTQLHAPENLTWSGDKNTIANWDSVDGAESYSVVIDVSLGSISSSTRTSYSSMNVYGTQTDLRDYLIRYFDDMIDTSNIVAVRFKVKANSSAKNTVSSEWSNYSEDSGYRPSENIIKLSAPTGLVWTGDNKTIASWDAVENAEYYVVTPRIIRGNSSTSTSSTFSTSQEMGHVEGTNYDMKDYIDKLIDESEVTSDITGIVFSVKAYNSDLESYKSSDWAPNSEDSGYRGYTDAIPIQKPTNLKWSGEYNTIASWDPVENAKDYSFVAMIDYGNGVTGHSTGAGFSTTETVVDATKAVNNLLKYRDDLDKIKGIVFHVRANSVDISKYKTSPWSDVSEDSGYRGGVEPVEIDETGEVIAEDTPISEEIPSDIWVAGIKDLPYAGVALNQDFRVYDGKILLVEKTDYTVTYKNNKNVYKISDKDNLTNEDKTAAPRVIVKLKGNYSGTQIVYFSILPSTQTFDKETTLPLMDINKVKADAIPSQPYKGCPYTIDDIRPYVKVKAESYLIEGKDYAIINVANSTVAGTAVITLEGLKATESDAGFAFTGIKTINFKIAAKPINSSSIIVNDGKPIAVTYSKGGATPHVVVRDGEIKLKEGKDFTVKYTNNNKVADSSDNKAPTMQITGKGNYSGKNPISFTITKREFGENMSVLASDITESPKAGKYTTKVQVYDTNGKLLKAGTDFEKTVRYYYDSAGTKEVPQTDNPAVGTVLYAAVTGKGVYSSDTVYVPYRVISKNCDIGKAKFTINPQSYTGQQVLINSQNQFSKAVLGSDNIVLDDGNGFEVVPGTYQNNIKKGTAKVTLHGKGKNGGYKVVSFKITAKPLK